MPLVAPDLLLQVTLYKMHNLYGRKMRLLNFVKDIYLLIYVLRVIWGMRERESQTDSPPSAKPDTELDP